MYFDERENLLNYLNEENNTSISYENNDYKIKQNDYNNHFDINNLNINNYRNKVNLFSLKEGFNKGNMFEGIYDQYKKHSYTVRVSNKRDELLLKIQELTFATKDLNLYLDIYPNDTDILNIYKKYDIELKKFKEEYEKLYGPLCTSNIKASSWTWINSPWPWNNKGGSYNV